MEEKYIFIENDLEPHLAVSLLGSLLIEFGVQVEGVLGEESGVTYRLRKMKEL